MFRWLFIRLWRLFKPTPQKLVEQARTTHIRKQVLQSTIARTTDSHNHNDIHLDQDSRGRLVQEYIRGEVLDDRDRADLWARHVVVDPDYMKHREAAAARPKPDPAQHARFCTSYKPKPTT